MTEEMVAALSRFEEADFLSREKPAIHFAERRAADHYNVDDEVFREPRR